MSDVNSYLFECEDLKIVTKDKAVYDALIEDTSAGVLSERILEMYENKVHGGLEEKILEAINNSKQDLTDSIKEISNVPAVQTQDFEYLRMFEAQMNMLFKEFREMKEMIETVQVANSLADKTMPRIKEPDDLSVSCDVLDDTMFEVKSDTGSKFEELASKSSGILKGMAKQMENLSIGSNSKGKVSIGRRSRGKSLKDRVR